MSPRAAPLTRVLDGIIELGWLFAILSVPTFFNLRDARIFEPDKIVLLRDIVIVMVIAFLIKALYTAPYYLARWAGKLAPEESSSFALDLRTCLRRRPTVVAALIFAVIYLLATFDSLLPSTSFWGSYDRMEGTYTYLTYITLFLLMVGHLRSWAQFERVVTAIILSSVPCAAYSWVQRFNLDPLVWGGSGPTAAQRTPSTLGNPIFEAAFLLMTVPFTLHRLVLGIDQWWRARQSSAPMPNPTFYVGMAGYAAALLLQVGAIAFSGSRGPGIGFLAGLLVFGLALAVRRHAVRLLQIVAACAVILVAVFGVTNTVLRSSNTPQSGFSRFLYLLPSESGTSEVRSLLWNSAPDLVKAHPVLGCGPEVLLFCWYPYYPSGLRSIELANAAPDRSHNEDIDIVLTTGMLGALAYLALIASIIYSQIRLLLRSSDLRSMSFAAALMAMLIGHMVEAFVGIAFSATLLLVWCLAAMSTALASGEASGAPASYAPSQTDKPVVEAPPPAREEEPAAASRRRPAGEAFSRDARRSRDDRRARQERVAAASASTYSFAEHVARIGGAGMAAIGTWAVVVLAVIVICCAQFVANIQLVQADYDYHTAQGYEQAANNVANQASQIATAEATYLAAIADYQAALNTLPSWNGTPKYDDYYLFLGRAYLEYADTLDSDLQNNVTKTVTPGQVTQAFQSAANVFVEAARANPLDPDHPRNLGKLYLEWSGVNLAKPYTQTTPNLQLLESANNYFQKAASLAPDNADIPDEWTLVNMLIGDNYPNLARAQYAQALSNLMKAIQLYPDSGAAYRDLGTVYAKYAQFAGEDHQPAKQKAYFQLARQASIKALQLNAPQDQTVYPRLVALDLQIFQNYCEAATFAQTGMQLVRNNTLPDTSHQYTALFQQAIALARAHDCKPTSP